MIVKMLKKKYLHNAIGLIAVVSIMAIACKKDDSELSQIPTVSRLYVSNADLDTNVANISIFDPADAAGFPEAYNFKSGLPDANGIYFDPTNGIVFQVGRATKTIKSLTVNPDGSLTAKTSFTDANLVSARDIAFDRDSNILYVASNTDSAIYVYRNATTKTGEVTSDKKFKLDGEPWGIHLADNELYVVIDKERVEVQQFNGISALASGPIAPVVRVKIAGATRLHGITYSAALGVMLLTDIGQPETTVPTYNTDGSIYIIDSLTANFAVSGNITPARTITGAATGLGNPVDIAIDDREGKGTIYVAEKANKKILAFRYEDEGNATPLINQDVTATPEAIYVDAR